MDTLTHAQHPMDILLKLFGVSEAGTDRIVQQGHWVPHTTKPPVMAFPPPADAQPPEVRKDAVAGKAFGRRFRFNVVSPRACEVNDGKVRLRMKSGQAALVHHKVGRGSAWLLGFCLQDTYFQMWKDDAGAREQLRALISAVLQAAKVPSHIHSTNPDIEATVRANSSEGYVFIINHEAADPKTTVRLGDLKFRVGQIEDLESGKSVDFKSDGAGVEFLATVPLGDTQLLRIRP